MYEYKAPEQYPTDDGKLSIFLAGTIDNGMSDNWQEELTKLLMPYDINILNPRRDDWSPDTPVDGLRTQINWEMDALNNAMLIVMYLAPNSKSPISMMELGLHSNQPIVVCCPDGFWRKTNVEVVCERADIPLSHDKEEFFNKIVSLVKQETEYEPPLSTLSKKEPPVDADLIDDKKEKAS